MADFQQFRLGDAVQQGQGMAMNTFRLGQAARQQQGQEALSQAVQSGKPEDMQQAMAVDPEMAQKYQASQLQYKNSQLDHALQEVGVIGQFARNTYDQQSHEAMIAKMEKMGMDTSMIPPTYSEEEKNRVVQGSYTNAQLIQQKQAEAMNQYHQLMAQASLTRADASTQNAEAHTKTADVSEGRFNMDKSMLQTGENGKPGAVENTAQMIAKGQMPALSGFVMKSPFGQAVMSRVAEINPDYSAAQFQVSSKAEKDFATGKQGNAVRSFNVALDHLNVLSEAAGALKNGNMQDFNTIANEYSKRTGEVAPTDFNAVKKIVADEIVKAIVGGGGGVSDREEAAKTINSSSSPSQLEGNIKRYKQLMSGQLSGLRQQYSAATGKDDFNKYLSSQAQTELGGSANAGTKTIHWNDLK